MLLRPTNIQRQQTHFGHELSIIKDIDSLGHFSNEFLLGYIVAHIGKAPEKSEWRILWAKLLAIQKMVINKIIKVEHVIQIVQVALINTSKKDSGISDHFFKEFMKLLDDNFHQVIINPNSLSTKYYDLNPEEKKNHFEKYSKLEPGQSNKKKLLVHQKTKAKKPVFELTQTIIQKGVIQEDSIPKEKGKLKVLSDSFSSILNQKEHNSNAEKTLIQSQLPQKKSRNKLNYQKHYEETVKRFDPSIQNKGNTEVKVEVKKENTTQKQKDYSDLNNRKLYDNIIMNNFVEPRKLSIKLFESPRYERTEKIIKIQSETKEKQKKTEQLNNHERQKCIKPQESLRTVQRQLKFEPIIELYDTKLRSSSKQSKHEQSTPRTGYMKEQDKSSEEIGIQCSICCEKIKISSACPVSCGHILHSSCLNEYFKARVEVKNFPILCPEEGCTKEISISDIQEYIEKHLKEKYFEFSLHMFVENSSKTSWCPTPGCTVLFEYEKSQKTYECVSCRKSYCLSCKTESHKNLSCKEASEMSKMSVQDKQFMIYARGARYKQCPSCNFWVSRTEGCDHMTCRCKYQFCYKCGGKQGSCYC